MSRWAKLFFFNTSFDTMQICMQKKILARAFLALIIILSVLTSCPTSPPLAPTDGFKPYLAPEAPSNVEATNGYANSIELNWENVEDATSYQVWATPVDQYGLTTKTTSESETYSKLIARGFSLMEIVTEPNCKLKDLEANTAYIFSIVAMKATENTKGTTVLYSEPSSFVQGSTFGKITLSAVSNSKTITLFWNISNLYSILSQSKETETLYNYNVAVCKKLNSSKTWGEKESLTSEESKKGSFSFEASSLEIDTPYDFKLCLEVLDAQGNVINTVESEIFTITTNSSPTPSSVKDISSTNGLVRNEVTLTWTAAQFTPQEDLIYLFKIERIKDPEIENATSDSNIWTEITSEIVQNQDGTYSITDTTVEDNTTYTYRIISGYQIGTKIPVYQEESEASTIGNVYSLWMPEDINFTFTRNEENKEGLLQVSYSYNPPQTNPSNTIECYIGGSYWTEKDLNSHTQLEEQKVDNTSPVYKVSIENIRPLTYYSFYFTFVLNGESLVNVTSLEDFTLGETGAENLIENLTASNAWVKAICLTWEETNIIQDSLVYEIYQDNVKLDDVDIKGTGSSKTAYIACEDNTYHNYRIKATSQDGLIFEVEEVKGSTLAIPTGLKASNGNSIENIAITWPQLNNDRINYTLKYSYDGTTWQELSTSTTEQEGNTSQVGVAYLSSKADGTDGSPVSFKLIVSNAEQLESGLTKEEDITTLESEIATGCVMGPALLNVRIENSGLDPDKITIKWDKVAGADHYKIMRDDTLLVWSKDDNTYEDSVSAILAQPIESPLNASYTYTVIPCLKDETQAVITSLSTNATATGKLFAPPKTVVATKGQAGITLSWDAVENATSYQILKYVVTLKNGQIINQEQYEDAVTVASTGSETETYIEQDQKLLSGNVLYKMCAVLEDGTTIITSKWQESYKNVKNSLGFEEASNIGYKLQEASNLNISSVINSSNYYEDYTKVTWYMVPGATSYTIKSYTGDSTKTLVGESTVLVNELTYSKTETVDNGKNGKGFLSYDPTVDLYTYYDGNINFKDSYEITNYEIIANSETAKSGTTNRNTKVYKQPNEKDWVNIILNILKPAFKAANDSFGGDWWLETYHTDNYKYPTTGMVFNLKGSWIATYEYTENYLAITSYEDTNTNLKLSSSANIQFAVANGGGAGYLGTDPLNKIGYGSNGTIVATPTDSKLKSFKITFNDVNVYTTGGSFSVSIGNGKTVTIENTSDLPRILGD